MFKKYLPIHTVRHFKIIISEVIAKPQEKAMSSFPNLIIVAQNKDSYYFAMLIFSHVFNKYRYESPCESLNRNPIIS